MTTLSLTQYFGLIVLAPIVLGAVAAILGLTGRGGRAAVVALAIIGAVIPAVALLFVIPAMSSGDPVAIQPFGLASKFGSWIVPTFRIDSLALFCGLGITLLVVPLLLWLALARATPVAPAAVSTNGTEVGEHVDAANTASAATAPARVVPATARAVGLILALESLALLALCADSLVIFGVAWLLVVAATWAVGEVATDAPNLDRAGLAVMLAGPLLWLVVTLISAISVNAPRWLALTGHGNFTPLLCILLMLALALAGGAYPALAWVRRRTALSGTVGLAAVALVALPGALYAAARTFTVAAGSGTHWPFFVAGTRADAVPAPITVGVVLVALGALTVALAGLLMLGRRDARALIALLASAQVGWGLVAVGLGEPAGQVAVVALLLSMVLGLGAVIAASVAGGALIDDMEVVEPEADGPRPAGAPLRLVPLLAWLTGAVTLLGAPFLAGYGPRQLISQAGLQAGGLTIPLVGLCWGGDALIALALLRAVAPAFQASPDAGPRASLFTLADLPGVVLALLALLVGLFPGVVLQTVVTAAAESLAIPTAFATQVHARFIGYETAFAQWPASLAWIALLALVAMLVAALPANTRVPAEVWRGGQDGGQGGAADEEGAADEANEANEAALAAEVPAVAPLAPVATTADAERLGEPAAAWSDLAPAFTSGWTMPANGWLLSGIDDAEDDEVAATPDTHHDEMPHDDAGTPTPAATEEVTSGNE
ncbi:MAG TPA: hypothetical protein VID73_00955 [Ktedonobacterales bacterium]